MSSLSDDLRFEPQSVPSFLRSEGEMAALIARFPWHTHPLGPLETWPQGLRTAVSLILNSRHPMWVGWGPEMWFLYNDAYLHVLGLAKHPWALGRPAEEVWAEIWDVCGPLADKVFRDGEASFMDDVRLFMSRGDFLEETFYSFSYSPIRDDSGEVAGLFCPSTDVTARVIGARRLRTLSELAASALLQRSTVAASESAIETLGRNRDDVPFAMMYLVNAETCSLQVSSGAEQPGRIAPVSFPMSEPPNEAARSIVAALRGGRQQRFIVEDVEAAPAGAADLPVLDALVLPVAGRAEVLPLGALVVGVNPSCPLDAEYTAFFELVASNIGTAIQNARAAEEERRRADMLAEMDRAKTEFFSNVSHEFRTPLTLMLGPLEELAQVQDERSRAFAQTARRNALRLLKLVNTLLEFSRLEAGRSDATFSATDLAALTRNVASSFRSAIEGSNLRFEVDTDLDEPVYVDRSMWERILLNLLSNALKFTFVGGITVALRRVSGMAELRVSDTGVGVPVEDMPRLFERFHRVRGAKSRSHEGSGIGLALVRDLAVLHGGEVDAESELGKGTTFVVRVPLGRSHLDQSKIAGADETRYISAVEQYLADVDATMPQPRLEASSSLATDGTRPRILVADDNADLRDYVTTVLAPRYDVVAVSNGRDGLDAARAGQFDLILSDVMMPEMNGFEFLRTLRRDDRIATTPFILLSARAGEEAAREGLLDGADDYIVKPFTTEDLLARVYALLNATAIRERATQELRASEERFRTLAASLPYIVFESDAAGAMTYMSDEYLHYTGNEPESGYGSNWINIVHPDDADTAQRLWSQAIASGETFAGEVRLRRHDGTYRWFTARALPQRNSASEILRWSGTLADVHDQRQAARERDFLARASEIFAKPLGVEETLSAIAWFTVPELADWCQIDLRTSDGRIKTVAVAHRDPEKNRIAQQFIGRVHLNPEGQHGSPYVIRSGKSELVFDVRPEMVEESVGDAEETRMYQDLALRSFIAVPLSAEGQTLGMLAVLYGDSQRRYSQDDVPMIEELGRRAGLALHRARLFEREHRAAASFQQASLPSQLPTVPGLVLDAYYAPGREEAQVGGDWYDALRLVDGRVVISIGDVAGSGLEAAVTMGNMRQIIRGIAQVHADPSLMLDAADRALRLEHPEKFVTAFVGVFDAINNTLTYASAGHPPPLLRLSDGTVQALSDSGLPLGLRSNAGANQSTTIDVPSGSLLVLYTDGLTEFERMPETGERRLRDVLADEAFDVNSCTARSIVGAILGESIARDDVAVLVVNICSVSASESYERGALQSWSLNTTMPESVGIARAEFTGAFARRGGSLDDVATAELVFGELVSNTVRYAPGAVDVIADWSGPEPVLHVLDNGPGFKHISILPPDLLSESGRGLFIVTALTADFRVSKRAQGGSHARAVLRLQSRQLVNTDAHALSGSLLYALTDQTGIAPD